MAHDIQRRGPLLENDIRAVVVPGVYTLVRTYWSRDALFALLAGLVFLRGYWDWHAWRQIDLTACSVRAGRAHRWRLGTWFEPCLCKALAEFLADRIDLSTQVSHVDANLVPGRFEFVHRRGRFEQYIRGDGCERQR